jgi:hypothetical protein
MIGSGVGERFTSARLEAEKLSRLKRARAPKAIFSRSMYRYSSLADQLLAHSLVSTPTPAVHPSLMEFELAKIGPRGVTCLIATRL